MTRRALQIALTSLLPLLGGCATRTALDLIERGEPDAHFLAERVRVYDDGSVTFEGRVVIPWLNRGGRLPPAREIRLNRRVTGDRGVVAASLQKNADGDAALRVCMAPPSAQGWHYDPPDFATALGDAPPRSAALQHSAHIAPNRFGASRDLHPFPYEIDGTTVLLRAIFCEHHLHQPGRAPWLPLAWLLLPPALVFDALTTPLLIVYAVVTGDGDVLVGGPEPTAGQQSEPSGIMAIACDAHPGRRHRWEDSTARSRSLPAPRAAPVRPPHVASSQRARACCSPTSLTSAARP